MVMMTMIMVMMLMLISVTMDDDLDDLLLLARVSRLVQYCHWLVCVSAGL